jgi:hypothetical protein
MLYVNHKTHTRACRIIYLFRVNVLRKIFGLQYYQLIGEAYLEGYNLGGLYSEMPDDALEGDKV